MTLKELVANCVRFVVQAGDDINSENIEDLKDTPNYRDFVNNALPEINRAIQEITPFKKFQLKIWEKEIEDVDYTSAHLEIDLSEISSEIYQIYKVELIDKNGYITLLEYRKEGKKLRIVNFKKTGKLIIRYYPRIRLLSEADYLAYYDANVVEKEKDLSIDLNELGIDDMICNSVIPYLVKAQLWQEIEPELAQLQRNTGLQNLSMVIDGDNDEPYQTRVFNSIKGWF